MGSVVIGLNDDVGRVDKEGWKVSKIMVDVLILVVTSLGPSHRILLMGR